MPRYWPGIGQELKCVLDLRVPNKKGAECAHYSEKPTGFFETACGSDQFAAMILEASVRPDKNAISGTTATAYASRKGLSDVMETS